MYKNIRATMNPGWREGKWYPEKRQLYEKIQQPTMETWLEKTQIMTMLTQTREKKTIHPEHCREMMRPKNKLLEQWKKTRITSKRSKRTREKRGTIARTDTRTEAKTDEGTDTGIETRTQTGNDKKGK